jgi:hypothetical protein
MPTDRRSKTGGRGQEVRDKDVGDRMSGKQEAAAGSGGRKPRDRMSGSRRQRQEAGRTGSPLTGMSVISSGRLKSELNERRGQDVPQQEQAAGCRRARRSG